MRIEFLSLCVLAIALAGCERQKCTSSDECKAGEICAGRGADPFECLKACRTTADCSVGETCVDVTSADCPECLVITMACLPDTPPRL